MQPPDSLKPSRCQIFLLFCPAARTALGHDELISSIDRGLTVASGRKLMPDGGKGDSGGKGYSGGKGDSGGKGVNGFEPYDYGKGKGKGKGKDKGKGTGKGKSKGAGKGGTRSAEGQVRKCMHLCEARRPPRQQRGSVSKAAFGAVAGRVAPTAADWVGGEVILLTVTIPVHRLHTRAIHSRCAAAARRWLALLAPLWSRATLSRRGRSMRCSTRALPTGAALTTSTCQPAGTSLATW